MTDEERLELELYRATEHDASGAVCHVRWKKVVDALIKFEELRRKKREVSK